MSADGCALELDRRQHTHAGSCAHCSRGQPFPKRSHSSAPTARAKGKKVISSRIFSAMRIGPWIYLGLAAFALRLRRGTRVTQSGNIRRNSESLHEEGDEYRRAPRSKENDEPLRRWTPLATVVIAATAVGSLMVSVVLFYLSLESNAELSKAMERFGTAVNTFTNSAAQFKSVAETIEGSMDRFTFIGNTFAEPCVLLSDVIYKPDPNNLQGPRSVTAVFRNYSLFPVELRRVTMVFFAGNVPLPPKSADIHLYLAPGDSTSTPYSSGQIPQAVQASIGSPGYLIMEYKVEYGRLSESDAARVYRGRAALIYDPDEGRFLYQRSPESISANPR